MRIVVLFAAAVLLMPAAGMAQIQISTWATDSRTGCKIWNMVPQPNETITWSGACQNGIAQGVGVLQWFEAGRPGDRYEGAMRDGKQTGHGVIVSAEGQRYDGNFSDGAMSGHGVYTYRNGDHYDGEWRNGTPNGLGRFVSATGGTVFGLWNNGCYSENGRKVAVAVAPSSCH